MVRKNDLWQHEGETLRGTRLKREPIFFRVTADSGIIIHYSSTIVERQTILSMLKGILYEFIMNKSTRMKTGACLCVCMCTYMLSYEIQF